MIELAKLEGLGESHFTEYEWLTETFNELGINGKDSDSENKKLYDGIRDTYWLDKDTGLYKFDKFNIESGSHLYFNGIKKLANHYREVLATPGNQQLLQEQTSEMSKGRAGSFIVAEHREELGSFRPKISQVINEHYFTDSNVTSLTADIGLRIMVKSFEDESGDIVKKTFVLCAICDKENDYAHTEKYHLSKNIKEICIKGEDEGIFYFCEHHDPRSLSKPLFLEKIERYDIFGSSHLT